MAKDQLPIWIQIISPLVVLGLFTISTVQSCSGREAGHTIGIQELKSDVTHLNEMHSGTCSPEAMRADIDSNEESIDKVCSKIDALIAGQSEIKTKVDMLLEGYYGVVSLGEMYDEELDE